jgi:cyclophilin family peptidyl-prolyl cis-trans isomerase/protein-disulfide isomerase
MRKFIFPVVMVAVLLLSACGLPAVTTSGASTPASSAASTEVAANSTEVATEVATKVFQASGPATCQADTKQFTFPAARPDTDNVIAPISSSDYVKGPDTAFMTIVEYADFTCPYCQQLAPVLDQFLKDYPNDVRLVYRHFPLSHDKSQIATQVGEAAALQGKFWEMHDLLFKTDTWQTWDAMTPADFQKWVTEQAKTIPGFDVAKFTADLNSPEVLARVTASSAEAAKAKLGGTPSTYIFLDGKLYFIPDDGIRDYANLQAVLELYKWTKNPKVLACPPMTIDPKKQYTATLKTERGDVVIQLFADKAPMAVNNFIYLAKSGWYDGVPFHRVIAGFVAQAGDPTSTGIIGPGFVYSNEVNPDLRFDQAGRVGMANSGADTNGAQFFITYAPQPNLDGSYTIFGQVTSGMDAVNELRPRDPQKDVVLLQPDHIISVTIEEK